MEFRRVLPHFCSCIVEIDQRAYSSGVLFAVPPDDHELAVALESAGRALTAVQDLGLRPLRAAVSQRLTDPEHLSLLSRSELLSLSVSWDETAREPVVSLAYGFDEGVCIVATMQNGIVADAGPAE